MIPRNLLGLASVAAAASGVQRRDADDDGYVWSRSGVLGAPETVEAGDETVFRFNWSHRSNRIAFEDFEYRKVQVFLGQFLDKEEGRAQIWCLLEPCVLPNVTSVRTTIPEDAFEDGTDLMLKTRAFDSEGRDDPTSFDYAMMISDDLEFKIEGGDAEASDWEKEHGWEIVGPGLMDLPCDKVPCVRSCVEEHLDPSDGSRESDQSNMDDFQKCTAECGVEETADPMEFEGECIWENAEESSSSGGSGGSSGSSGSSTSGDDNDNDDDDGDGNDSDGSSDDNGDGDEDAAIRLTGANAGWLLAGLAAWAVFAA